MTENNCIPHRRSRTMTGLALIALGLLWLANEIFDFNTEALFLPALGLVFLIWGVVSRQGGLLIPGGVLTGLGAGVYLMDTLPLEGSQEPGVFMLSFAGGWLLIILLSAIFTEETHWWALWPAGIMALIGGGLLMGGPALQALEIAGRYWPVLLIIAGIAMLFKRR